MMFRHQETNLLSFEFRRRDDETRVHNDYSVIASEFCDFLATVMTYRLINKFTETKLLEKKNYGKIMSILRRAKKVKADNGGWQLI